MSRSKSFPSSAVQTTPQKTTALHLKMAHPNASVADVCSHLPFSCKYKEIMAGTYCGDLFEGTNHAITIDILKGAMRKFAFDTPGILKLELSGQVILDFLLDHFVPAVLYYDSAYCTDGQAPSKADKKLLAIFSGNYKQDYQNTRTGTESFDLYLRLLMVTDYISGMTDSYARTLYRELSGIE